MKTSILTLIFLYLFQINISAQFLETGNLWIYDFRDYSILNGNYTEKFDSIVIVGDTIINSRKYFHLVSSEKDPCGVFVQGEFLREENNKIFRLSKDGVSENLMIDFDAADTYDMVYESQNQNLEIETTVIVDSIQNEILPSGQSIEVIYQRIINNASTLDNATYKLSRKAGYLYQPLFPVIGTGLCDNYLSTNLRCFVSKSDTLRFTEFDCFESSKTSSIYSDSFTELLLTPNPTSGDIYLTKKFDLVNIYNANGRLVKVISHSEKLTLSDLDSGMYLLHLFIKDKKYISKVIKN